MLSGTNHNFVSAETTPRSQVVTRDPEQREAVGGECDSLLQFIHRGVQYDSLSGLDLQHMNTKLSQFFSIFRHIRLCLHSIFYSITYVRFYRSYYYQVCYYHWCLRSWSLFYLRHPWGVNLCNPWVNAPYFTDYLFFIVLSYINSRKLPKKKVGIYLEDMRKIWTPNYLNAVFEYVL